MPDIPLMTSLISDQNSSELILKVNSASWQSDYLLFDDMYLLTFNHKTKPPTGTLYYTGHAFAD